MKWPQVLTAISAIAIVVAIGPNWTRVHQSALAEAQADSGARNPRNAAELDAMFNRVSNWGRWGKDDQLGAINLITEAKRKQAATLVEAGISVSLAHDILTEKTADNPRPYQHLIGPGFMKAEMPSDTFTMSAHGFQSHIDTFCHVLYKDKGYNGYSRSEVLSENGCLKGGVELFKNGIVTRGILIDMPLLKGVPYLEPGTPVYVEDLEAWEKKAGVKISSGDAILLRTGSWALRATAGPEGTNITGNVRAGYHSSVAPWMKMRDVALVGSDSGQDVAPTLVDGGPPFPLHALLVAGMGVPLLDMQDLEAVAATAAKLKRWEFMLVVAPFAVPGGTGSPVNALAIF